MLCRDVVPLSRVVTPSRLAHKVPYPIQTSTHDTRDRKRLVPSLTASHKCLGKNHSGSGVHVDAKPLVQHEEHEVEELGLFLRNHVLVPEACGLGRTGSLSDDEIGRLPILERLHQHLQEVRAHAPLAGHDHLHARDGLGRHMIDGRGEDAHAASRVTFCVRVDVVDTLGRLSGGSGDGPRVLVCASACAVRACARVPVPCVRVRVRVLVCASACAVRACACACARARVPVPCVRVHVRVRVRVHVRVREPGSRPMAPSHTAVRGVDTCRTGRP